MKHTVELIENRGFSREFGHSRRRTIAGWKLLFALGAGLILSREGGEAQSCSAGPNCLVQYQLAGANLDKCPQFVEYTNDDWPRIHIYQAQTTHVYNYQTVFTAQTWTNADSDAVPLTGGQGGEGDYSPGTYVNNETHLIDETSLEWEPGPD